MEIRLEKSLILCAFQRLRVKPSYLGERQKRREGGWRGREGGEVEVAREVLRQEDRWQEKV